MKKLTGNQVRQMFLDYFTTHGHMIEPGASLVPVNDPSLLWINSGVAALKKYLDGREKPKCNRICNAQKCIRTNDIENVGKTARHHTFFEMLGNWSIGDYFKEESLKMSWEFLTSPEWIGFDPKRIYVTMYPDDNETYRIWTEVIGLDPSHILKSKDNFWEIGEGPCGPDSEIYYDRGPKYDPEGKGEALFFNEEENDRYVELWNNVFSQYDAKEGVDRKDYKELPQKNIDTGMGLERLVCFLQEGETNFDTDLFLPIIHKVEEYTNVKYEDNKMAFRVIADHIRTCTFALADGASFSNEGRGYVLRRVLRRAMRYARYLGINKPFLYEIVDTVVSNMDGFYPYLDEKKEFVKKLIKKEEESFIVTLANGEKLLENELNNVKDGVLKGEVIFKLYDTYGFPSEMTIESCENKGIKADIEGFKECMNRQKELARSSRNQDESMHTQSKALLDLNTPFTFTGYTNIKDQGTVTALFKDGELVSSIDAEGDIILDKSCFYATSGGQIYDTGVLYNDSFKAKVVEVKKAPNGQFMHHVIVEEGSVKVSDILNEEINAEDRLKIRANHSSLHLLQSALRKVLGDHVAQAGSYVCKDYARFDFNHFDKISYEDLRKIEAIVNDFIANEYPITTEVLDIESAKKTGATALFDEKYGDTVRVVSMGDVSKEFCGGTHAENTADLGSFRILGEESIGSGIRRIECCTKLKSYDSFVDSDNKLEDLKNILKLKNKDQIITKVNDLLTELQDKNNKLSQINNKLMNVDAVDLMDKAKEVNGVKYLVASVNPEYNLRNFGNIITSKNPNSLIVLVQNNGERNSYYAAVGKENTSCNAKEIIAKINAAVNGKGGGNNTAAQGSCALNNEILTIINNILEL